jgi:molybdate transport system substrate-binding protein
MQTITVYSGLAMRDILENDLIPSFLGRGGISLERVYEPTAVLRDLLRRGGRPDVFVGVSSALHDMERAGEVRAGSVRSLVRSDIGVAAASTLRSRSLGSVSDLRDLLRAADSIAYSASGASGAIFQRVLEDLGLEGTVRAKAVILAKGFTAEAVRDGRAEVAIQQVSELATVPEVEILGSLPAELGAYVELSAAVGTGTEEPELASEFIDHLRAMRLAPVYAQAHLTLAR